MIILDALFPRHTYRRMIVSTLVKSSRSPGLIGRRLVAQNWKFFLKYRGRNFTCNVCGEHGYPLYDFPDLQLRHEHGIGYLRETLQCKSCGATLRHRTLAAALLRVISKRLGRQIGAIRDIDACALHGLRILDTDVFSPISKRLKRLPGYVVSSFCPDLTFDREIEPGHFNINLENIGFESSTFDIVLTSDVMEHVRHADIAHREISRILKTGGYYVFTVPYNPTLDEHKILVDTSGTEDVFLVPPQYHGDPLTGGILAYRIFGKQIYSDLQDCGLHADFVCIDDPAALIIEGDVFITQKCSESAISKISTN